MATSRTGPLDTLRLTRAEQITLAGVVLALMNADISAHDGDERRRRERRRNRMRKVLRDSAVRDRQRAFAPLELEKNTVMKRRLAGVKGPSHAAAILIEASASEPFATLRDPAMLAKKPRRLVLRTVVDALPGVGQDDLDIVDAELRPRNLKRPLILLGAGAVGIAGIAVAGVAAPAIGAAIGGTMGLSGAAATSAGLAALGGGSLAAGGMGMAGGTLLITAGGGVLSAGAGAVVGARVNDMVRRDLQVEGRKLVAFLVLLHSCGHKALVTRIRGVVAHEIDRLQRQLKRTRRPDLREELELVLELLRNVLKATAKLSDAR